MQSDESEPSAFNIPEITASMSHDTKIILKFPRLCNISHNKIQEPRFSLLSRLNIIIRNIYLSISGKSKIVEFINFENPRVRVRAISKVLIPRIFFINLKNNTSLLAQS